MDFCRGLVVYSKAGKDKGEYFTVVKSEEKFVFVANGKRRVLENPKRKNMRHLGKTNKVLDLNAIQSNKQLSRLLAGFGKGTETNEGGQELV